MVANTHPIILICIGLCTLMLICVMGRKFLLTFFGKMLIGVLMILGINMVMPESLTIGVNIMTIVCSGILGIPGVIMLYLINFLVL